MTTLTAAQHSIRAEMAATLRIFQRMGFEVGSAGHLSVRDSENPDHYWVNPFAVPFASMRASDVVLANGDGEIIFGPHTSRGFQSHLPLHRARPEIGAVVHVHTPHAFAWSNLGRTCRPLSTDSAEVHRLQAVRQDMTAPLPDAFADTTRILITRYHGATTAGATLAEAAFYMVAIERAAREELLLAAVPDAAPMPEDVIDRWAIGAELADGDFRMLIDDELTRDPLIGK